MLKKPEKPLVKPYADYPLTPHASGYWVRKIKGKTHYVGARWASPEHALTEWNRIKESLLAGIEPLPLEDTLTVKDALNHFLCDCKSKVARGDIVQRTYADYVTVCKHTVKTLGASTPVMNLNTRHFAELRNSFPGQSPNTIANWVVRTKVAFNWLHNSTLVEKPFSFGNSFKKPSAKAIRGHRNKQLKKLFKPDEVRLLVQAAHDGYANSAGKQVAPSPQLSTMILLGINCGFGNNDCGRLPIEALDLDEGWQNFARPKTEVIRRCWLWPETLEALRGIVGSRTSGLVFTTRRGNAWSKESHANPLSVEFKKLADAHKIKHTYYALRHTFETIAGGSKDQVATDSIMGHVPTGMSATYREEIDDARLREVSEHVRRWYIK